MRIFVTAVALASIALPAHAKCTFKIQGDDAIFEGCNVVVRNGTGSTTIPNGLGNVIVGYDEPSQGYEPAPRTGSHNVVVGDGHAYAATSGIVTGSENKILGDGAAAVGGS